MKIIFRGDSGFCRWRMLRWCEKSGVDYVVGLAKNTRLLALLEKPMAQAAAAFQETKEKQRHFVRLEYAAQSWDRPRTVIAKAEHTAKGANPQFILTSLEGGEQKIHDDIYCARGEMENQIEEHLDGGFPEPFLDCVGNDLRPVVAAQMQAAEDFPVEALVAQLVVETLDVAVFLRTPRCDDLGAGHPRNLEDRIQRVTSSQLPASRVAISATANQTINQQHFKSNLSYLKGQDG